MTNDEWARPYQFYREAGEKYSLFVIREFVIPAPCAVSDLIGLGDGFLSGEEEREVFDGA